MRGYGVLQPRVSVSLANAARSRYAKWMANSPGLDPYCTAISDVYQDLFGEGSFTGKGIYDLDAFAAATAHAFPENQILSHDLIEGCHARVGLLTDVELYDEYPSRFDADVRRQHRWARGDWQLLPWLFPRVPTARGERPNPLTWVSRWKVFDNLRRSLVPAGVIALLLLGWLAFPTLVWSFTLAALVVLSGPLWFQLASIAFSLPHGAEWLRRLRDALKSTGPTLIQCGLSLTFLPYKAQVMLDAAIRTLYRQFVSRRDLLDWETSDATERRLKQSPWSSIRSMGFISVLSVLLLFLVPPSTRMAAAPILLAWIVSPLVADWVSRPPNRSARPLSSDDQLALRRIARKTWSFFETFVQAEDNWLPPDNFQEYPKGKIAHRLSPTNEGLYMLSAVAARDFGYVGLTDLATRLEQNLASLHKLEMYRGHFLNWYDTTTLTPLNPRYVSSADSGNLAGCLLAASEGLQDVVRQPLFNPQLCDGVLDTVEMIVESLLRVQPRGARFVSESLAALESGLQSIRQTFASTPNDAVGWRQAIDQALAASTSLPLTLKQFETSIGLSSVALTRKVGQLVELVAGLSRDLDAFMPWTAAKFTEPASNSWGELLRNGGADAWQSLQQEFAAVPNLETIKSLPRRSEAHLAALRGGCRRMRDFRRPSLPRSRSGSIN